MFDENAIELLNKWASAGAIGVQPALRVCRDLVFFRQIRGKKKRPNGAKKIPAIGRRAWTRSLRFKIGNMPLF